MHRRNRSGKKNVSFGILKQKAVIWDPGTVITCCPRSRPSRPIPARAVPLQYRFPVSDIASRSYEEGWEADEQHAERIFKAFRGDDADRTSTRQTSQRRRYVLQILQTFQAGLGIPILQVCRMSVCLRVNYIPKGGKGGCRISVITG